MAFSFGFQKKRFFINYFDFDSIEDKQQLQKDFYGAIVLKENHLIKNGRKNKRNK